MNEQLYEACRKSICVITPDGKLLNRGPAVIFIMGELGYNWTRLGLVPPVIYCVNFGYDRVANNRKMFSKFLFTKERNKAEE